MEDKRVSNLAVYHWRTTAEIKKELKIIAAHWGVNMNEALTRIFIEQSKQMNTATSGEKPYLDNM